VKTLRASLYFGVFVVLAVLGWACNSRTVEFTVFHTNNLHSHLGPSKVDPFGLGGVARLSTLLKRLRSSRPISLTVDGGDWSEGSWYYSVDTGANMLRLMGTLGYDAVALGNHDFLSGPDRLQKTIEEAAGHPEILAGNLDMTSYPGKEPLEKAVQSATIKTIGELKVGIIGLTTYEFLYDSFFSPVKIINPFEAATRLAMALRPSVDVLLILSPNTFEMNVELARTIVGVDAVIGGHSHKKTTKAVLVKNMGRDVPVVEAGEWGKFIGDLKLTVDVQTHFVRFSGFKLHAVVPEIEEDPEIVAFIEEQDRILNERYGSHIDREIATAEMELGQSDHSESPLGNLAVKAYRWATGADLSLDEISLTSASIPQGSVTLMDLHDVVPHLYQRSSEKEWTLQVWDALGSDLALLINIFYTANSFVPFSSPLGWLSADNVQVVWNPFYLTERGGLPAVRSVRVGDKILDQRARYKVALTEGLLRAIRQADTIFQLGLDLTRVADTQREAWRVVSEYAESIKRLDLETFRVGRRTLTEGPDAALFYYSINRDVDSLRIEIENHGLAKTNNIEISCSFGIVNDPVVFETSDQKWTEIGRVTIAGLAALERTSINLPWGASLVPAGIVPVKCELFSQGDSYAPNNSAVRVFKNYY
jgi:5'-nucleotidase / UDP-sugar diphosphatase